MSFCNYSMMNVSECGRVIGSGDLSGNVMLLSPDNLFKVLKNHFFYEKINPLNKNRNIKHL